MVVATVAAQEAAAAEVPVLISCSISYFLFHLILILISIFCHKWYLLELATGLDDASFYAWKAVGRRCPDVTHRLDFRRRDDRLKFGRRLLHATGHGFSMTSFTKSCQPSNTALWTKLFVRFFTKFSNLFASFFEVLMRFSNVWDLPGPSESLNPPPTPKIGAEFGANFGGGV